MSLCSYQTNRLVCTIAPDHQACMLQWHLTSNLVFIRVILSAFSIHVCYSFILSDTLARTSIHICYSNIQPPVLSVPLAPDQYSSNGCYNCTQPAQLRLTSCQDGNEHLQHTDILLRSCFCVDTLHSIRIFSHFW